MPPGEHLTRKLEGSSSGSESVCEQLRHSDDHDDQVSELPLAVPRPRQSNRGCDHATGIMDSEFPALARWRPRARGRAGGPTGGR
jgi:hypothetical protein